MNDSWKPVLPSPEEQAKHEAKLQRLIRDLNEGEPKPETLEEWLLYRLWSRGLFRSQAEEIITSFKKSPFAEPLEAAGAWKQPHAGYPDGMLQAIWKNCCPFALKWIDEKAPRAWFRGNFETAAGLTPIELEED